MIRALMEAHYFSGRDHPSAEAVKFWLRELRTPELRRLILSQEASPRLLEVLPPLSRQIATRWDRMYLLGEQPDYEPPPERRMAWVP